jgi:hypothetical protein
MFSPVKPPPRQLDEKRPLHGCSTPAHPGSPVLRWKLLSDPHDVALRDGTERGKSGGYQWGQIAQAVRWSAENHQGNLPSGQILLIRNFLVDSNENVKSGGFRSFQETPIL